MAINTTAIKDLLRPGLNAVFGDYKQYPTQWKEIFETRASDKASEDMVEMKMLGLAQLQSEGAGVAYDTMGQRAKTTFVHRYIGLGFIVTRQALKDNLYQSRFPMQARTLRRSFAHADETLAAAVINNAFDTAFPVGDALPLASTAHVIDGSTQANRATTNADLNETSLQNAIITVQRYRDNANLRVMTQPVKLILPTDLQFVATRLLKSQYQVATANNDVNAIVSMNSIPQGFVVNQFLTDTNGWTLKTDAEQGFIHFAREPLEVDFDTEFDTDNLKVKGIKRDSYGVGNWRCGYFSAGAA